MKFIYKTNKNNNNSTTSLSKMLTLPHILLQNILSSLDNLDRICFALSCKKWYQSRDNFLLFDTHDQFLNNFDFYLLNDQFKLNSFRKSLCKSIYMNSGKFDFNVNNTNTEIPMWANYLYFSNSFNDPFQFGWIPECITTLHFGFSFDQYLEPGLLPSSIKTLKFGNNFDQKIVFGAIPNSVVSLTFGKKFNNDIDPGVLPKSIKKLVFGEDFDCLLMPGSIPSSVTKLKFGNHFNSPIKLGVLPNRLKSLIFGYYFNYPLEYNGVSVLPPTLQELSIGRNYLHYIDPKILPTTLNELHYVYSKTSKLQSDQPNVVPAANTTAAADVANVVIPTTTKSALPKGVTHLMIDNTVGPIEPGFIPETVTNLQFLHDYQHPIMDKTIPSSVKRLEIGIILQQLLKPNQIPEGVEVIEFGNLFNRQIESELLPTSAKDVRLGSTFQHVLPSDILANDQLEALEISGAYRYPLPASVRNIHLMSRVYYNFRYDSFDFESLPIGTTIRMEVPTLEQITIRIMSKQHALLLTDNYFLGGFMPISSLKTGYFTSC
ncbi:hypothetical protein PPL_00653 [Heterostelium album PN500]|uniref:F-box domain-containing protein n=1 Tax=Heterostelium pallidum (strain ATCC 26659 / Pp 5 / PN500) TaxID=670386 RepID=D3AX25_HETP5|nr:hypothetical protein PPL_00653 [Heterostelium album PN500]EFA86848.1 hypothetical protein PPL_00653 [Heterostelium album PN500]|eukprot:XP_020438951.1 hypothetical protein PPL_00653 [Heterostelium album PN500]